MSNVPVFVGLDYHASRTQICILDRAGKLLCNKSVPSDTERIASVIRDHGEPSLASVEACGGAAQLAHELIEAHAVPTKLTHPGYVSRMRHNPDKSDLSDARMLAELARCGFLPEVWLAPDYIRDLRSLIAYRQQLVQQRRAAKVRILAQLRERRVAEPPLTRWTLAWMGWLTEHAPLSESVAWIVRRQLKQIRDLTLQIREVERRLATLTEDDAVVAKLRSMPGIGEVTAWTLRADVGLFDRFANGKQLARYCGLSPRNASSGQRVADAGLIKAGRARLKSVLIQAAHCLARFDPKWRALYKSLRARGKPACVAIAAVANRWVRWLHAQMVEPSARAA